MRQARVETREVAQNREMNPARSKQESKLQIIRQAQVTRYR